MWVQTIIHKYEKFLMYIARVYKTKTVPSANTYLKKSTSTRRL